MSLSEVLRKHLLEEESKKNGNYNLLDKSISKLEQFDKVLLLTCSNRYNWDDDDIDIPKSTILGMVFQESLGSKATTIDVPELNISPCEGNVSRMDGNSCGLKDSKLKSKLKNPTGHHRCWASINNPDDELWKISKELFEADAVIFFSSVRWGQANMYYQKLIERLTWLENRHTTLGESNLLKNIKSGFICTGQNWHGTEVVKTQKSVHNFFGFEVDNDLYWNWQYTNDEDDETQRSYKKSFPKFIDDFRIV
jgi:multimeric flavodoxin WrbA